MNWFRLAVCALFVFALLALTAIDTYTEQNCRNRHNMYGHCGGFLPW